MGWLVAPQCVKKPQTIRYFRQKGSGQHHAATLKLIVCQEDFRHVVVTWVNLFWNDSWSKWGPSQDVHSDYIGQWREYERMFHKEMKHNIKWMTLHRLLHPLSLFKDPGPLAVERQDFERVRKPLRLWVPSSNSDPQLRGRMVSSSHSLVTPVLRQCAPPVIRQAKAVQNPLCSMTVFIPFHEIDY